jgi:hypothetical protein
MRKSFELEVKLQPLPFQSKAKSLHPTTTITHKIPSVFAKRRKIFDER